MLNRYNIVLALATLLAAAESATLGPIETETPARELRARRTNRKDASEMSLWQIIVFAVLGVTILSIVIFCAMRKKGYCKKANCLKSVEDKINCPTKTETKTSFGPGAGTRNDIAFVQTMVAKPAEQQQQQQMV